MTAVKPDETSRGSYTSVGSNHSDVFDIVGTLRRHRWIVILCLLIGLALGIAHALKGLPWYQSHAKMLINAKNAGLSTKNGGPSTSEMIESDVLANHIEVLRSRRIVQAALEKDGLTDLDSIQPFLSETCDPTDYVIGQLELTRGGGGDAKTARSLDIAFVHTNPEDSQRILESVLVEYQVFIVKQVESVLSTANSLVSKAKTDVEKDLRSAEQEYMEARREAPLLFQGEGSSNVYQEKYRRLEDELLNLQIEEATVRTRYEGVLKAIEKMDGEPAKNQIDQLALIDGKSMERLGVFAGLKMNASSTAEFMAAQPERIAEAQAEYSRLLELMSEKQRLSSVYGSEHPKVQDVDDEITLVKNFLGEKQEKLDGSLGLGDMPMDPESLLKTYVGFLKHDLSAFEQRRLELQILSTEAEKKAKLLIDFEIREQILRNKIARQEELFHGVVQQLTDLDTASGLTGYTYELLESPRYGAKVWPSLPLSALGGIVLGLLLGLSVAVANDLRDQRFRSADSLQQEIGLPMLGQIGKISSVRKGVKGLIATESSSASEAFRMGRTLLLPDIRSKKLKTLGVTGALQGDGKSSIASNFAVSIAQIGLRVLVIDADLRRPRQHRFFSVPESDGLTDVLMGDITPQEAIRETKITNVSIIPAGSESASPAELLQSVKLDELLEELGEQFDIIIVDLPPVLAVSDPLIVAPRLGGVVMVVKVATAKREEIVNSVRRLRSAGVNLVGCMLNAYGSGKDFDRSGYAGYYESSYSRPARQPQRSGSAKSAVLPNSVAASNGASIQRKHVPTK